MAVRRPLVVGATGEMEQLADNDELLAKIYTPPPQPLPVGFAYRPVNLSALIIPPGAPVAVHNSGQGVVPAIAGASLAAAVALAQEQLPAGVAGFCQTAGLFSLLDWSLVTGAVQLFPRGLYFLDPTIEGRLTLAPPTQVGQIVQLIGQAVSLTTLSLVLRDPIQL